MKPIVYYIDPATPAEVRRLGEEGHRGLAAGVRSGRLPQRDRGTRRAGQDDPDWSPEDARYSVIRWLPSTIENASGPHIHDPRTGEILEADIQFYHNVQNLAKNWYFVQVGPLDPRAKTLPLPDDLMGELDSVRRRARGRTHARLPAQHEGQLAVLARSRSATGSG